jgi:hypothetical protein
LTLAAAIAAVPATLASCASGTHDGFLDMGDASDAMSEAADVKDAGPDLEAIAPGDGGPSFNLWPPGWGPATYYGGPVMLGIPNIYFIWYGNWQGSNTPAILEDLIKGFSGTGYAGIMQGYYQTPQAPLVPPTDGGLEGGDAGPVGDAGDDINDASMVPDGQHESLSGNVSFARSVYVGYTHGQNLHDKDIKGIVADMLHGNVLPYDSNGVYFVLTSGDVTEADDSDWSTFCGDYCGWHSGTFIDQVQIHYSFVGSPDGCLDVCSVRPGFVDAGISQSPNNNWPADAMASVIIHEMCESLTDPQPEYGPAWLDPYQSSEIGDMCAWRFDPTYHTLQNSRANVRFGGRDFLIQQMWVNDNDGGRCDLQR